MATSVRNIDTLVIQALVTQANAQRLDELKIKAGTIIHADASTAITQADASASDPTIVALANAVKASYNAHVASAASAATGQGAHIAADATNPTAVVDATDLTTAQTLLNDIKAKYNAHRVLLASHATADATNVIASADATNQATAVTLANELKTDINLHYAMALASTAILLVSP